MHSLKASFIFQKCDVSSWHETDMVGLVGDVRCSG